MGHRLELKKIVKEIENTLGFTHKALADALNTNESRVKQLAAGNIKSFKEEEIDILVNKYKLSRVWILTGEGEMFSKTGEAVQHQSGSGDLGDQNSLTNFDLWQVNGGVGIGGNTNTLNLKYRDNYVKLEQLAVMGGIEGAEAPIKGLEKLKDELKQYI